LPLPPKGSDIGSTIYTKRRTLFNLLQTTDAPLEPRFDKSRWPGELELLQRWRIQFNRSKQRQDV